MLLKNRNISSKIKRSNITDYAALNVTKMKPSSCIRVLPLQRHIYWSILSKHSQPKNENNISNNIVTNTYGIVSDVASDQVQFICNA